MAANINPIFPLTPKIGWGTIATANTAKDGTGTVVSIFTAGADGARVDRVRIWYTGTCVATVLRIFINNGSTNATATNNSLIQEITVPAATLSEVAAQSGINVLLDMAIPAGYVINCTIGTTVAAALVVTAEGGDY